MVQQDFTKHGKNTEKGLEMHTTITGLVKPLIHSDLFCDAWSYIFKTS